MGIKKGVKKKEHEKLDDTTIERVISLLNDPKPITKKVACEILNISYNTTRLNDIITEYISKKKRREELFEKTKGKPLTDLDISDMVTGYLQGATFKELSEWSYRPVSTVKAVIESIGVPTRPRGDDYYKNSMLPEECILKEPPKVGDFLWTAKYHSICKVTDIFVNNDKTISYNIYVYERFESRLVGSFYAYQPIHELGSLTHLQKYINIQKLIS